MHKAKSQHFFKEFSLSLFQRGKKEIFLFSFFLFIIIPLTTFYKVWRAATGGLSGQGKISSALSDSLGFSNFDVKNITAWDFYAIGFLAERVTFTHPGKVGEGESPILDSMAKLQIFPDFWS